MKNPMMVSRRGMFFCVDVDWDFVHKFPPMNKEFVIMNSACLITNKHFYNDMEIFLVNTVALDKVLASYDIDTSKSHIRDLKNKIEVASRIIGKYRAADNITKNRLSLYKSVLNGLDAMTYFDSKTLTINEASLIAAMPSWSNYPHHVDDLIKDAEILERNNPQPWSLSNGHDVTEMLAEYIKFLMGYRELSKEKIERELRLSCELHDFSSTPMYSKMVSENLI